MTQVSPNPANRDPHERAIQSLAAELQAPAAIVRRIYEFELEQIAAGARVTEFLAVFVRRSTRECLLCDGKSRQGKCASRPRCTRDVLAADADTPAGPLARVLAG